MDKTVNAAISSVMSVYPLIKKYVIQPMKVNSENINPTQIFILVTLKGLGASTMSKIAEEVAVSNQQLTKLVDELVEKGLVARQKDPDNRRLVLIDLTEKAETYLTTKQHEIFGELVPAFEKFSNDELITLARSSYDILNILQKLDAE